MSTVKFNTWQNTDGTENYKCRAWVNFDGTTNTGGNCDIRASGNVSSVADNGEGDYTVNFATAMPDANYSVVCPSLTQNANRGGGTIGLKTTSNRPATTQPSLSTTSVNIQVVRFSSTTANASVQDSDGVYVAIFR